MSSYVDDSEHFIEANSFSDQDCNGWKSIAYLSGLQVPFCPTFIMTSASIVFPPAGRDS